MQNRYTRERQFHNESFGDGEGKRFQAVSAFYSVSSSFVFYKQRLVESCTGAHILEYGCGPGSCAFLAAGLANSVVGIDISDVAIAQAEEQARKQGLTNVSFEVMNAEELRFADDSFDVICGSAILHHLDLRKAFLELARVLKPGGSAFFVEPLGHNPAINLYRTLTPKLRTVDEHPLLVGDLELAGEYFDGVDVRFFQLLTFVAIPFRRFPFFRSLRLAMDRWDQRLFRALPYSRRHAWQVVIELSRPRKARQEGRELDVASTVRGGG
jgi:SAM-dependent methyltransferase